MKLTKEREQYIRKMAKRGKTLFDEFQWQYGDVVPTQDRLFDELVEMLRTIGDSDWIAGGRFLLLKNEFHLGFEIWFDIDDYDE